MEEREREKEGVTEQVKCNGVQWRGVDGRENKEETPMILSRFGLRFVLFQIFHTDNKLVILHFCTHLITCCPLR